MSLKSFHIFFIVLSIAITIVLGVWAIMDYDHSGSLSYLALGMGSFASSVGLAIYGVWFLRKMKDVSYL